MRLFAMVGRGQVLVWACLLFIAASPVPDPRLTPGAIDPKATVEDLDSPKFIKAARHVTDSTKKAVYRAYGLDPATAHMEIDHRVPICVGGLNCVSNLWPEPWYFNVKGTDQGAHQKDRLEVKIHQLIQARKMTLSDGQALFLGDWRKAYLKYVGDFPLFDVKKLPQKDEDGIK